MTSPDLNQRSSLVSPLLMSPTTMLAMRVDYEAFRREVMSVIAAIPRGKVVSYGQINWNLHRARQQL